MLGVGKQFCPRTSAVRFGDSPPPASAEPRKKESGPGDRVAASRPAGRWELAVGTRRFTSPWGGPWNEKTPALAGAFGMPEEGLEPPTRGL